MDSKFSGFVNSILTPGAAEEDRPEAPRWLTLFLYFLMLLGLFTPVVGVVICTLFAGDWFLKKLERAEYLGAAVVGLYLVTVVSLGLLDAIHFFAQKANAIGEHLVYSVFYLVSLLIVILIRRLG